MPLNTMEDAQARRDALAKIILQFQEQIKNIIIKIVPLLLVLS
jgi:hypothetical protein